MFIVDSQVHIWAANTPERPWFSVRKTHRTEPLDAEQLLCDMNEPEAGVVPGDPSHRCAGRGGV
jgi:hypothetical protein